MSRTIGGGGRLGPAHLTVHLPSKSQVTIGEDGNEYTIRKSVARMHCRSNTVGGGPLGPARKTVQVIVGWIQNE